MRLIATRVISFIAGIPQLGLFTTAVYQANVVKRIGTFLEKIQINEKNFFAFNRVRAACEAGESI
jgi:hypothetical protein